MRTDRPVASELVCNHRLLRRSGRLAAFVGATVAAIFLAAMGGSLWWAVQTHRRQAASAETERIRVIGESLARSTQALLTAGELSTLRRLIAEAGVKHDLEACRVLLPDGRIIADSDPLNITAVDLPASWPDATGPYAESVDDRMISVKLPLSITGRGQVQLEIAARTARSLLSDIETQSGIGMICALGLLALLLVYRHCRVHLRAIAAVRQALLAGIPASGSWAGLEVDPRFGPEAVAWNRILADRDDLAGKVAMNKARQSMQSQQEACGDIGAACDALPQGLVLVDANMRVKYVNGAAAVLLQAEREKMVGADISDFIREVRVLEPIELTAAEPGRKRTIVEIEQGAAAGGGVLRYVIRPVRREDSGVAMVIIEDITQQRVAQKARNEFLAQATHELRTPLANIRLYVETALDEDRSDPSAQAKCFNVINQESRRLERIVSDILSVSEIEAGSLNLKRDDVHLEQILAAIEEDYEPQARDKNINLSFQMPPKFPVLCGDRDKISLAMHNLVGNALKYTPEGGQVTVSATVEGNRLSVDVTDTGIGVGEGETEKIFEKFYRARNGRLACETGSGLGLAFAREVARLHGGDIEVQTELNKGSTFTLTLPVAQEAA